MGQHKSHASLDKQPNSKFVASSKQRRSPNRTKPGVDLRESVNAKSNREGDLRTKLDGQKAAAISKVIVPIGSVARTS